MKTIAIPIFKSRVSVRLDCTDYIHLITIEQGVVKSRETVRLIATNPLEKVKSLIQLKPDVLICGGLTEYCSKRLEETDIQIIPWIRGGIEEIMSRVFKWQIDR